MPAHTQQLVLGALLASLVTPTVVGAQLSGPSAPLVAVGTRVRVRVVEAVPRLVPEPPGTAPGQRLYGTVRAIAPETLYVDLSSAAGTAAIPRAAIRRVEMSRGRPSRRVSALEVGVNWAVVSALLVPSLVPQPERRFGSRDRAAAAGAGLGLAAGALLGALRPYERWRLAWIPE